MKHHKIAASVKNIFSFFTFFVLTALSCRNNREKPLIEGDSKVAIDVPAWYVGSPSEERNMAISKKLNLEPLQYGTDSLQIRILIDCGYDTSNLWFFETKQSEWSAVFYSFKIAYNNEHIEVRDVRSQNVLPKSGWESFSDSLIRTGILNLTDFDTFPSKYIFPTDANGVSVEIATPRKYRFYEYPSMGLNAGIKEGPWKLHQALKLIENEFGYHRPCEDSIQDTSVPANTDL